MSFSHHKTNWKLNYLLYCMISDCFLIPLNLHVYLYNKSWQDHNFSHINLTYKIFLREPIFYAGYYLFCEEIFLILDGAPLLKMAGIFDVNKVRGLFTGRRRQKFHYLWTLFSTFFALFFMCACKKAGYVIERL